MSVYTEAMERLHGLPAQVPTEVMRGIELSKRANGIPVLTVWYYANPARDPETPEGKVWYDRSKATYSSEAAWKREQEIDYLAGGGERVFAKILSTYEHKVLITDPGWMPDPRWKVFGGFDHGKVNATAFLKGYVDFDSNIYLAGEFYSMLRPGWSNEVSLNVPVMLQMPDLQRMSWIMADPSIFAEDQVQSDGSFSSINKTYRACGFPYLREYAGERSDVTFVEDLLSKHWNDLENKAPKLFIVCRNKSDRPQPGLHPYDCPNLVWELNRTKRVELTARQLMTKNPSEKILDKQNHCRDSFKYLLFTLKTPSLIDAGERMRKALENVTDPTSRSIAAQRLYAEHLRKQSKVKRIDYRRKARMR